jgi:hypothetical protein
MIAASSNGIGRPPATTARMYDHYLGGVHTFRDDREAAEAVIAELGWVPSAARANREFVVGAVRYLVRERGVRQFLDIGCGVPGADTIHAIAHTIDPAAVVAYVDQDPIAVAAYLDGLNDDPRTVALRGDLGCPQPIVTDRRVRKLIDFDQPITVVLGAVLHYLPDTGRACHAVRELVDALPAGSCLVFSHLAAEAVQPESRSWKRVCGWYQQYTGISPTPRSRRQVNDIVAGLSPLNPGLVAAMQWCADPHPQTPNEPGECEPVVCWAGIRIKCDGPAAACDPSAEAAPGRLAQPTASPTTRRILTSQRAMPPTMPDSDTSRRTSW